MQPDYWSSLLHIKENGRAPLARRIAAIEERDCFPDNVKSLAFVEKLRCFLWVNSGGKKKLKQVPSKRGYVAISYPWNPSREEDGAEGGYMIQGRIAAPVRDIVLDRTIKFIRWKRRGEPSMLPFWVDQLSINQQDKEEKALAVQSMDRVYMHCEFAIGYLWVEMRTRRQMDLLANLLKGCLVNENQEQLALAEDVSPEDAQDVLALLLLIIRDRWWERAWIFQEDHLAGWKMWLLIRHSDTINKDGLGDTLEGPHGEVAFQSARFKKHASLFCLAYRKATKHKEMKQGCDEVLRKAGKYSILYKHGLRKGTSITTNVLRDVITREITNQSDILAIVANACQYDRRIDIEGLEGFPRFSLSLALLALLASNGELLRNDRQYPGKLCGNILTFLENQLVEIDSPVTNGTLTFMKHCKLPVTHLSRTGIHAGGLLWEIGKSPNLGSIREMSRTDGDTHLGGLFLLTKYLEKNHHRKLAGDIKDYLNTYGLSDPDSSNGWPASRWKTIMASHVSNAVQSGQRVRLGRLFSNTTTPYRAIFVCDETNGLQKGSFVFTSWNRPEDSSQAGLTTRRLAKYASVSVETDGFTGHEIPRLRTGKWVNGLCFFNGEKISNYVFPWPESLFD